MTSSPACAQTVLDFAALATILVAIPAPAVMLVLKSAMLRGRGSAVVTALGVRLLLTSEFNPTGANGSGVSTGNVSRRRAFGEGFLCDLSNPKTVLVYASVIPQFLTASNSPRMPSFSA